MCIRNVPYVTYIVPQVTVNLVMSIEFSRLEGNRTSIRNHIGSGVYLLKLIGNVVYVGKSRNVLARISGPDHAAKEYDEVEIHWMPEAGMLDYERTMIKDLRPIHNQVHCKPRNLNYLKRTIKFGRI